MAYGRKVLIQANLLLSKLQYLGGWVLRYVLRFSKTAQVGTGLYYRCLKLLRYIIKWQWYLIVRRNLLRRITIYMTHKRKFSLMVPADVHSTIGALSIIIRCHRIVMGWYSFINIT